MTEFAVRCPVPDAAYIRWLRVLGEAASLDTAIRYACIKAEKALGVGVIGAVDCSKASLTIDIKIKLN